MKRCPDREKLYLYLDKELNGNEAVEIKAHIQGCPACRKELKVCEDSEKFLQIQFDQAYSSHRSKEKILEAVKNFKDEKFCKQKPALISWIVKAFALAIAAVFIAALIFIPRKIAYHGTAGSVTMQALGVQTYVDGKLQTPGSEFSLNAADRVNIVGHFLFELPDIEKSSFSVKGKADVTIEMALPVFSNADIEMFWLSGLNQQVKVNAIPVLLKAEVIKSVEINTQSEIPKISDASVQNSTNTSDNLPAKSDELIPMSSCKEIFDDPVKSEIDGLKASESAIVDKKAVEDSYSNKSPFAEYPVAPLTGN